MRFMAKFSMLFVLTVYGRL